MSRAVLRGDTSYLLGQVAEHAAGEPVAAQTRESLAGIDRLLTKAGTDNSRLRAAHTRLTDMGAFAELNGVCNGWMIDGPTHERTTVEISERLGSERGLTIGITSIWTFLDRHGLTFRIETADAAEQQREHVLDAREAWSTASSTSTPRS